MKHDLTEVFMLRCDCSERRSDPREIVDIEPERDLFEFSRFGQVDRSVL